MRASNTFIALGGIFFLFTSCMGTVKPSTYEIPFGSVQSIVSETPINVLGTKVDDPKYILEFKYEYDDGTYQILKYALDVNDANERVAKLIINELKKNNVPISQGADKTITVNFLDGRWEMDEGMWYTDFPAYLSFEAITKDGRKRKYEHKGGGMTINNSVGDSIEHIAEAALKDPVILDYIQDLDSVDTDINKLKKLKTMFEKGLITEQEYIEGKKTIIENIQ